MREEGRGGNTLRKKGICAVKKKKKKKRDSKKDKKRGWVPAGRGVHGNSKLKPR